MLDNRRMRTNGALPSVLVVDDDIDALAEICEIVAALGLSVKGVDTVRAALVAVSEDENIGLIITDLNMNVMDGFDLLAELDARHGPQRKLATIVLSGFPSYDNALESLRLGVNDFIEKPATMDSIKKAIRRAFLKLDGSRTSQVFGYEEARIKSSENIISGQVTSDLQFVKELQKQRRRRNEIIRSPLFSDPAWDILLDLMAAKLGNELVSVSSACAAAQVPFSTGLRYVNRLVAENLAVRLSDPNDRRRDLLQLTDQGFSMMNDYIKSINKSGLATSAKMVNSF